jgi:hypothetical protein
MRQQKVNKKGQFIKGNVPWNKGLTWSDEVVKKISDAQKGKVPWNKGIPRSEETKGKLRAAMLGRPSSFRGKHHTERAKSKLSAAQKGRPGYWLGKKRLPFSEEWRRKMGSKGKRNPNWRGGVTKENHLVRNSFEYELWKEVVFERDDFTCQSCGKRGGDLHAHHILPFAEFPHLRFAVNNGQILCVECHRKVHKK